MIQPARTTTTRRLLLVAERRAGLVRGSLSSPSSSSSAAALATPTTAAVAWISTQCTLSATTASSSTKYNNPNLHSSLQKHLLNAKSTRRPRLRHFGTGTRGARGHGWFVNYRAGKGGRHLQGEYIDHPSLEQKEAWNAAVMEMGLQQQVYFDVVVEPRSGGGGGGSSGLDSSSLTGPKHRLTLQLATAVMPETTNNFVQLCQTDTIDGLKGSLLYRFERNVGICGGDVLTNTGRTGKAAATATANINNNTKTTSPLALDIAHDPLVLWHLPGTVTMTVHTVGSIDSRFVLCTQEAPHLDGIQRAFGRLTADSLAIAQEWQKTLLTRNGFPTSYDLIIADCGVLPEDGEDATMKNSPDEAVA